MDDNQAGSPAGPAPATDGWDALRIWLQERVPARSVNDCGWAAVRGQVDPELLRRWARQNIEQSHPGWDKDQSGYVEANLIVMFVSEMVRYPYLAVLIGPAVQRGWPYRWAHGQAQRLMLLNAVINNAFGETPTEPAVLAQALGEAAAVAAADPEQADRKVIAITVIVGLLLGQADRELPVGDTLRWLTALRAGRPQNLDVLRTMTYQIVRWVSVAGPEGWVWVSAGYTIDQARELLGLPVGHPDRPGPDQLAVMAALREPDDRPAGHY